MTKSPPTASALRRAFSTTRCSGTPWVSSSTPGTTTSNSMPSFCRISRRCGDPDARTTFRDSPSGELGEPDPDLPLGRLVGVGAVDHVEGHLEGEVAADRAGSGLDRVGGANQLARRLHRFGALEHHRHQGAAGDEGDELAEEGLVGVLGVVVVGDLLAGAHRLQGGDPQALALEAGDHLAGEGAFEGVRLDEDQGPAHGGGSFALWFRGPLAPPPAALSCGAAAPGAAAAGALRGSYVCVATARRRRGWSRSRGRAPSEGRPACRRSGKGPSAAAGSWGSASSFSRPGTRSWGSSGRAAAAPAARPL